MRWLRYDLRKPEQYRKQYQLALNELSADLSQVRIVRHSPVPAACGGRYLRGRVFTTIGKDRYAFMLECSCWGPNRNFSRKVPYAKLTCRNRRNSLVLGAARMVKPHAFVHEDTINDLAVRAATNEFLAWSEVAMDRAWRRTLYGRTEFFHNFGYGWLFGGTSVNKTDGFSLPNYEQLVGCWIRK